MLRLLLIIAAVFLSTASFALEISSVPIEQAAHGAPSIVTFVVDDSGSMDFEFMTKETEGMFGNKYYLFPSSKYVKNGSTYRHGDNSYQYDSNYLSYYSSEYWQARFFKYNTVFYNPSIKYDPWPGCENADTTQPAAHVDTAFGEPVFTRQSTWSDSGNTWRNNIKYKLHDTIEEFESYSWLDYNKIAVSSAHYYTFKDKNNNGALDNTDVLYLVNFSGGAINLKRDIYKVVGFDSRDRLDKISYEKLQLVSDVEVGTPIISSKEEDIQNFANWFTYYRKRGLAATATVAKSIANAQGALIGLYTINESVYNGAMLVKAENADYSTQLIKKLYTIDWYGGTPLRNALKNAGEYLRGNFTKLGASPYYDEANGGSCQQAFTVLITDGFWNDDSVSGIGKQDNDHGSPFSDAYSDTLADVAMKYYKTDLRSDIPNLVAQNNCDSATHQHMVTFTMSFGVKGTLDHTKYPRCLKDSDNYPVWPNPHTYAMGPQKIDDLWHAAVNSRGAFFSADDPSELQKAMESVMGTIDTLSASSSKVAISTTHMDDNSMVFKSIYKTDNWSGDLHAYKLTKSATNNTVSIGDLVWSASETNKRLKPQDRVIVTMSDTPVEFLWEKLNNPHKTALGSDGAVKATRGEVVSGFKKKDFLYGDMVHSSPVSHDGIVYIGANDGMLHAFDAETGEELFNVIPSFVVQKLKNLSSVDFQHQFYVDGQIHIKRIAANKEILIFGLGAGGKGYVAFNIHDIKNSLKNTISRDGKVAELSSRYLWEFPGTNNADMGLSYSEVTIVRANNDRFVAIFGNGYNSNNGEAVLHIVDAETGQSTATLRTGAGNATDVNGLSTPAVIDISHSRIDITDGKCDFVYAGDLKGNLWKFDLTSEFPTNWKVAYGTTKPIPLFQAIGQPITTKPDVTWHLNADKQRDIGVMVVFGTGKLYHINDISNITPSALYGVWDYNTNADNSYVGRYDPINNVLTTPTLKAEVLIQNEIGFLGGYRFTSQNPFVYDLYENELGVKFPGVSKGQENNSEATFNLAWVLNLPGYGDAIKSYGIDVRDKKGDPVKANNGERLINSPIIKNGRAIFVTTVPRLVSCGTGGQSMLMELNPQTGAALSQIFLDTNDDGIIDNRDNIESKIPSGRQIEGFAYQPVIIDKLDDTEAKLINTSSSKVEIINESTESEGTRSWREVRK